jgi:hypothetical protein
MPMRCVLEIAYEGLDQNPFKAYDPFDFDLADSSVYPLEGTGVSVVQARDNRVEFQVEKPDFLLKVDGFDKHIRLRARLNYSEKRDGQTVSAEQSDQSEGN